MKQKVVWCISKYALPPQFGAQGRLFFLSEEFNKAGYKSYVITSSTNHLAKGLPNQKDNIRTEFFGLSEFVFLKGMLFNESNSYKRVLSWIVFEWRLFNLILFQRNKIDKPNIVIVSSLSLLTVINGFFAKRKFKCKFFFDVRDIWPMSFTSILGYSKYNPFIVFLRGIEKFGYRKADYITSCTPFLNRHIEKSIKKPFKFIWVSHGFDKSFMDNQQKLDISFIKKYIPENKFIVAYTGNIGIPFNYNMMLKCIEMLQHKYDDIHFIILGEGTYKNVCMERAKGLNNITFIPKIPKFQLQDFLSYCDLLMNFYLDKEVFKFGVHPQKMIDYLYAEKPVLTSCSEYDRLLVESNCGFSVPANDVEAFNKELLRIKQLPNEERVAMGKRGKKYLLDNLSWEILAQKYIELF